MRHEATDAESAYPMPLAMSCLFPSTGGAWRQLPHHKHRAKGGLSGNSSEANRPGERREKVVKVASLSTLEVSTEMSGGTLVPRCGWLTSQPLGFLGNENASAGPGVPVKGARVFPRGDYHGQPLRISAQRNV